MKVTLCCPHITCTHNTSDDPTVGGFCKSEKAVILSSIEAKSLEDDFHYGKIIDTLLCTGYGVKPEYASSVNIAREPEGEALTL